MGNYFQVDSKDSDSASQTQSSNQKEPKSNHLTNDFQPPASR